jgi:undecaprenyl diphosphate synthase
VAFFSRKAKPKAASMESSSVEKRSPSTLPNHIAIIMDGNGRWAQAQGLPRVEGHRKGADTVQRMLEACGRIGIQYLTLYCFSNENWKRPQSELDFLMRLLKQYLIQERPTLMKNNIRLRIIGRRDGLPAEVLEEMDRSVEASAKNTSLTLCLAINYGARQELVDTMRSIANDVATGNLSVEAIDENTIADRLYTADIPDPDLLIRTSGEMRISNFLLWQISYSELWVTSKAWPEFSDADLEEALAEYSNRQRRFGGLNPA